MAETIKDQGAGALAGSLDEKPFARIFYQLATQKKTGSLDICTSAPPEGKIVKRLQMLNGANFCVQGGSLEETLARVLVSQGRLSEQRYQALKQQLNNDYKRLEEAATKEAGLNPQQVGELYQAQAELKIKNCFSLVRGWYQFRDSAADNITKGILVPVNPEKIMIAGVALAYPKARIAKEFPDLDKKHFKVKPELTQNVGLFGLGPKEQRWLRGLGKEFMIMNVTASSGLNPEAAEQMLLALYLAGYLELPAEEEDFPLGKAYAEGAPKEKKAAEKKPVEEKKEVKKEEPKLPIEEILDKEMNDKELLAQIDKMLEVATKKATTFFDILGVEENTPAAQIKKVYFKMARIFHPDAKPALYKGEVRDKVEALFTRIGEAYSTLSDPDLKKQYAERLKSTVTDAEMEKANRVIQAEMEMQKGVIAIRRGSFKEAAAALADAIKLVPDEPEFKIYMGYAQFKLQGVASAGKYARMIEEAMKERPGVTEGWFFLGVIYRVTGEIEKARGYFNKALELDSYHQDSRRELRVIEMKLADAPKKGKKK